MKYLKMFEGRFEHWQEDLLDLSDIFLELEDRNICRIKYDALLRRSDGLVTHVGSLIRDKIEINKYLDSPLIYKPYYEFLLKVILYEIKYKEDHPFSTTTSFFGQDANIFLELMKYIDVAKKRMPKYKLGISLEEYIIYLHFFEKE